MSRTYHENKFPQMDYDTFYQDHYFEPVRDEDAVDAHRIMPRVAWALDVAKEIKPKRVLDLGCLEGYAVNTIVKHVPSVVFGSGVDLSQDGIEIAQRRADDNNLDCVFTQGTIEDYLEGCTVEFDLVLMFEVIEHVKDPTAILKLIDKVLAPGGTVLISTPAFESPNFGKDDEQNKCHVRLYTMQDEDYEEANKYGNVRKATSMPKQIGKERIIEMEVVSELINVRYS